jgi:hypothetical protein
MSSDSVAASRLSNLVDRYTQGSQSLALGLTLTAAPQLVEPSLDVLNFPRLLATSRLPPISRDVRE